MTKFVFSIAVVLIFGLAALAQDTTPGSPQSGTQSTNPTTGTSSTSSATGSGQYGGSSSQSSPSAGSMGQSSSDQSSAKGEKKLKGCIESQGGQYVLREKNGNEVQLTGSSDFASHVGHQVTVHGTYSGGSAGAASSSNEKMPSASGSPTANPSSSSSASGSGQQFMVSKIDHESSTCKVKGASGANSGMGNAGSNSSGNQAPDHQ